MLVLMFRVAGVPYGLAVGGVVEVVPRVALRPIPHAPAHLVGLLRYRGGALPVVDLGLLMGDGPCRDRLDTRIILVDAGPEGRLGLIAERVDDVATVDEASRAAGGAGVRDAPYLGAVFEFDAGLVQLVDPARIPAGDQPAAAWADEAAGGVAG